MNLLEQHNKNLNESRKVAETIKVSWNGLHINVVADTGEIVVAGTSRAFRKDAQLYLSASDVEWLYFQLGRILGK